MQNKLTSWTFGCFSTKMQTMALVFVFINILGAAAQVPATDTIVVTQTETITRPKALGKLRPALDGAMNLNWGLRFPFHLVGIGAGFGIGLNWLISFNVQVINLVSPKKQAIVFQDPYSQRYLEANADLRVQGFNFRVVRSFLSHRKLHPFLSVSLGFIQPDWQIKETISISAGDFAFINPAVGLSTNLTRWCRPYASIGWRLVAGDTEYDSNPLTGADFGGFNVSFGFTIMRLWN